MAAERNIGRVKIDVVGDTTKLIAQIKAALEKDFTVDIDISEREAAKEGTEAGLAAGRAFQRAFEASSAGLDVQVQRVLARRIASEQNAIRQIELVEARSLARRTAEAQRHANQMERIHARAHRPLTLVGITSGLSGAANSFSNFERAMDRSLRAMLISVGVWSAGVATAVGTLAAVSVVQFAKIERAAAEATAVFASGELQQGLLDGTKTVKDFGRIVDTTNKQVLAAARTTALETLFDTGEVSLGLKALGQAGLETKAAIGAIPAVAKFAQNESLDLNTAVELLTGGLNAAGKSTKELTSLTDQFTTVANATNASAKDVADAFSNRAAASFRAYGRSAEEALTIIALLARANERGAKAGTTASIIVREVARASIRGADAFKKYGIEAGKVNGKQIPLATTLSQIAAQIERVQETSGDKGVQKLREELGFTEKSFGGILQIVPQINKEGTSGLARLTAQIQKSQGATARQASVIQDTIAFQFDVLKNNVQNVFSEIGEGAAPEIKKLTRSLNGKDGLIAQLTPTINEFGAAIGRAVARFGEFLFSPEFRAGMATLKEAVTVTLQGIKDAAAAFSSELSGKNSPKSFFESVADSILLLSQVSAAVLPKVAEFVGKAFAFVRDNPEATKFGLKFAAGIYIALKAIKLIVVPLISAAGWFGKIAKIVAERGILSGGLRAIAARLGPIGLAIAGIASIAKGFISKLIDMEKGSGRVSKAFDKLWGAVKDLSGSKGFRLLGDVIGFVFDRIEDIGEGAGKNFVIFIELLGDSLLILTDIMNLELGKAFDRMQERLLNFSVDSVNFLTAIGDFAGLPGMEAAAASVEEIEKRFKESSKAADEFTSKAGSFRGALRALRGDRPFENIADSALSASTKVDGLSREVSKFKRRVRLDTNELGVALISSNKNTAAVARSIVKRLSDIREAAKHGVITEAQADSMFLEVVKRAKEIGVTTGVTYVKNTERGIRDSAPAARKSIEDGVKKSLPSPGAFSAFGKNIGKAFRDGVRNALAGLVSFASIIKEQVQFNARLNRLQASVKRIGMNAGSITKNLKLVESAIKEFSKDSLLNRITVVANIVDKSYKSIAARARMFSPLFTSIGRMIIRDVTRGMVDQSGIMFGFLDRMVFRVRALMNRLDDNMDIRGMRIMRGLHDGMKSYFDETIAPYLHDFIPKRIAALKGPVAYDATILVPAGEAIMGGLDRGLRRGFGVVESFLKDVGPSMEEFVPDSVFSDATKKFMVDVAMGETPDPYEFFEKFIPEGLADYTGILDPTLAFLHKTLSLADTEEMAAHLAKLYGLSVSSTYRTPAENAAAGGSPTSQHMFGQAADMAGGFGAMDKLAHDMRTKVKGIFKQILWQVVDHYDHVHLGFMPGDGFDLFSGKKGSSIIDFPGSSKIVDIALSQAAAKTGVAAQLLAAIAKNESGFNPSAVSPVGAGGLMQLMPGTAAGLGVSNVFDPFQNALGGAKYIKQMLGMFNGDIKLALAGYNAGPGAAHTALQSYGETIEYVRRVLNTLKSFGGFREHGGSVLPSKWYVTGENGPEIFKPSTSGTIIPAGQSARMMSQGGPQITDNRQIQIVTAASDPMAIASIFDAHFGSIAGGALTR